MPAELKEIIYSDHAFNTQKYLNIKFAYAFINEKNINLSTVKVKVKIISKKRIYNFFLKFYKI